MSPRKFNASAPPAAAASTRRLWTELGTAIRDRRIARRWSMATLAGRAGVSRAVGYLVEAGHPTSLEAIVRLSTALGLRIDFELTDQKRKPQPRASLVVDAVHSAMGEFEARHLRGLGSRVGLDEPYQHYQFAGRADLVAWDFDARALLHIENRTRFPDFQEMAGAYNAKRAYLADAIAERTSIARWASQTHVIAALWSSEVLHALRLRTESFRSLCPDQSDTFAHWWAGQPARAGSSSTLIVLDPLATGSERRWIGLDDALSARPRYRGYADAAIQLAGAAPAA